MKIPSVCPPFALWKRMVIMIVSITLLCTCSPDNEVLPPDPQQGPTKIDLYLSSLNWDQDSIQAVQIIFNSLTVQSETAVYDLLEGRPSKTLDLLDSGLLIGSFQAEAGTFLKACIELEINKIEENGNVIKADPVSYVTLHDQVLPLFSTKSQHCLEEDLTTVSGQEMVLLLEFNLAQSVIPGWVPIEDGKQTLCHIPPGNPCNAQTIRVDKNAVRAHLAHGDFIGPCDGDEDPVEKEMVYTFYPWFSLTEPLGTVEGALSRPDPRFNYAVYAYRPGTYNSGELSNGMANALKSAPLDNRGNYHLRMAPGIYDLQLVSFRGNSVNIREASRNNVEVKANTSLRINF